MKIVGQISRKVYIDEDEGTLVYEKISTINDAKPFWGITANVINALNQTITPYKVKLIWKGHGGILIDKNEIIDFLSKKETAKDGDYKINYSDLTKLKARWNYNLQACLI